MSESRVFKRLYRRLHAIGEHRIMVNNFVWPGYGECDVISITEAGYVYEFEIKTSRADFKAELRNKQEKHQRFLGGFGPNYFYFVTDERFIGPEELPPNMGLMLISDVVVRAKAAHKNKADLDLLKLIANRLTDRAYGKVFNPYVVAR